MRVGFATVDWARGGPGEHPTLGGAGTYRIGIPAKYLKRAGHHVVVGTLLGHRETGEFVIRDWDEVIHDGFDIIVMQRWMLDNMTEGIARARAYGQVIVNDVDDDFWSLARSNRAHAAVDPSQNPIANRNHYTDVLLASDLITVSTPALAERVRSLGCKNVALLRNMLDAEMWPPPRHDFADDKPVIGWVGAIPWRSGDLEILRGVLGPFCEDHGLTFHHSGAITNPPTAAELLRLSPRVNVTLDPMVPIQHYPKLFAAIDVGLVPLNLIPFNEAKSTIKGLEYTIAGIPFVASGTAEYQRLHDQGVGRTATKPKHWRMHLTRLLDPEVRKAEAKANRATMIPAMTATERIHEWEQVYELALGSTTSTKATSTVGP